MNMHEVPIVNKFGSLARFVATAKKDKPLAWKRVELLRVACALSPTFSLEQSAAALSEPITCHRLHGIGGY